MKYDVVIAGAGMGGLGAAMYFARHTALRVLLIEKEAQIGGTAVTGGVNCFEPGVCQNSILPEIVETLLKTGKGQVQKTVRFPDETLCSAISALDVESDYETTLKRGATPPESQRRFMFDPDSMVAAIRKILSEGNISIMVNCCVTEVVTDGRQIRTIKAEAGENPLEFEADWFIDATGDIALARFAGCAYTRGAESKAVYDESGAPDRNTSDINGVTYVFRVSKSCDKDCLSDNGEDLGAWRADRVVSCINTYPNGDFNINMLPTMNGEEFFSMEYEKADRICQQRVFQYWEYLKKNPVLKLEENGYHLSMLFPLRGIRESYRLVGRYVLTQDDLLTPPSEHHKKEHFAAYADHPIDIHGKSGNLLTIDKAYGIPFECMQPCEYDNLLVACRGASFSHIAAASARLSRTMLSLGEAAAKYIAENGITF